MRKTLNLKQLGATSRVGAELPALCRRMSQNPWQYTISLSLVLQRAPKLILLLTCLVGSQHQNVSTLLNRQNKLSFAVN